MGKVQQSIAYFFLIYFNFMTFNILRCFSKDVVQPESTSGPCTLCAQCFVSDVVWMLCEMHWGFLMVLLHLTRDKKVSNVTMYHLIYEV